MMQNQDDQPAGAEIPAELRSLGPRTDTCNYKIALSKKYEDGGRAMNRPSAENRNYRGRLLITILLKSPI